MSRAYALIATPVLLAACDSAPTPADASAAFLHAQVVGAFATEHRGGAVFSGGTMSADHFMLHISSHDPDADSHLGLQMLGVRSASLEPGVYPLEPRNFLFGDADGNTAIYLRGGDRYVAESGTLTITHVSHERLEGSFEMTAVFWCRPSVDRTACYTLPEAFPPDAPRIDVWGEFSAIRPGDVPTF